MVNLLPTVLVGGPPNAGKSVLFYHLTQALRERHIPHHAIRACPDGEGNWFHEADPETVSTILKKNKGAWPASFVQRMGQDLENRRLPLLVDMGGSPKAAEMRLFRQCTHSILLLRADKPDDTQRWQHIVEEYNLLPLAHLSSEENGDANMTASHPLIEGTFTNLDRHKRMPASELFETLVERIADLFRSYDLEKIKKAYLDQAPTELTVDLEAALRTFTNSSTKWEPTMLPSYLASLPKHVPLSVYGVGPNWLYAALAAHAGQEAFYLFDPKLPFGWVEPVQVTIGGEESADLHVERENYEECTVLKITFPADRLHYFQPHPLAFPEVRPDKGIIIDGKTPYWLLSALVRLYQEIGVPWIAPFYVHTNQAVVAYSRVEMYQPGDLVPRPLP